jgi:flagellar biosynthetic protein FliQ
MTPEQIIGIGQQALLTAIQISAPILAIGLLVGLVISIFQAVTQIQELTLTFVPKLFAMALVLLFLGKWMIQVMINFTFRLFQELPNLIG